VRVHYSTNISLPENECTKGMGDGGLTVEQGALHMAFEAPTTGYIGLGFGADAAMQNSDVVWGFISSDQTLVNNWHIPAGDNYYYISINPSNSLAKPWAKNMGIVRMSASGRTTTTLCFSRAWTETGSKVATVLSTTGPTNFIWAVAAAGVTDVMTQHTGRGSVLINLATGSSEEQDVFSLKDKVNIHGALMTVAWVLLLPLGTLFARHRPLLGDHKLFGLQIWFQIHRAMQLSGMVLFIVGFAYAVYYFPRPTVMGETGQAHRYLGYICMGLAGTQVIAAFIRPAPDAPQRKYWNMMHHYLGRLTIVVAWTAVYLGIYIFHEAPNYQASYTQWLVPVAVVMGTLVIVDIVLTLLRSLRGSEEKYVATPQGHDQPNRVSDGGKRDVELQAHVLMPGDVADQQTKTQGV